MIWRVTGFVFVMISGVCESLISFLILIFFTFCLCRVIDGMLACVSTTLKKGWRGFYVNKHHEMASKADAVIAFLKQNVSSESVEVNHYLVAMQNMNAMQFGFKDVVLFFFKEDHHVLLNLAGMHYCIAWLGVPAKLNEAFDSVENVILIFSVNRTRHFQGCARMASKTGGFVGGGNWKYEHGTTHYGRNFGVRWLKLCELSFHKTRHLRNPYNENLPVKRKKRKKVRKMKTVLNQVGPRSRPPFSQQQQPLQSSQNSARSKRDQPSGGGSQTMGQDTHGDETQLGGENTFKNGESESEDKAPRRSRHEEGMKKRRTLEGDAATISDDKT
ncbi:30-kDa cleavage and polyadenylation specificity factor 30 [Tanacetum coccineum]